ncbi:SCAN domain-containing protein 3-like, partial [Aphis craccivora]
MIEKSKNVRKQLFSDSWLEDDRFKGWLRAIPDQPSKANCIACNLIFGTKKSDIIRHSESQRHIRSVSSLKNVTKLNFKPDSEVVKMRTQVQKTELMLAHYAACHNLSFRSIDHLSQLPRLMMNDSKIVQQISIKHTKCVKLIKNVLASVVEDNIVKEMENKKFSIYLDETTDIANIKVLAILVKYIFNNRIQTHLLDLVPVDAEHGTAI